MNPNTDLLLDPAKVSTLLAESITQVFADMAFLDVLSRPLTDVALPDESAMECISLDVLKPVSIRIELRFSAKLKKLVNDNLFSGEETAEGDDSLLEMLNVTAGNFLIRYYGEKTEPKLELPEYLFFDDNQKDDFLAKIHLIVEGEALQACVRSVRYHY